MSPLTLTRGRRVIASATVAVLAAGAMALTPATAQSATPAATLQWKISDQFADHLSTHRLSGGARENADRVISFVNGSTTHDATTGLTEIDYRGTVTGAFVNDGTPFYEVTVSNPTVEVAADGSGRITADVSSEQFMPQGPTSPPGRTEPTRVTVTRFDAAASTLATRNGLTTLTTTPRWAGVVEPGSQTASDLGMAPGRPADGKSFDPEFLRALWPGTRPHFYWTTGSDAKAPAPFTAAIAPTAAPVAPTVSTTYGRGGTVRVTAPLAGRVSVAGLGTRPAAAGQTVGFALPRATTAGTKRYAVVLDPTAANLSPSTTTVTVRIAKATAARARLTVAKKPTRKAKGRATVRVKGVTGGAAPTGTVRLKLTQGSSNRYVNVRLVRGQRAVGLPKLAKGTWTIRAAYYGDRNHTKRGYVKVGAVKVTK